MWPVTNNLQQSFQDTISSHQPGQDVLQKLRFKGSHHSETLLSSFTIRLCVCCSAWTITPTWTGARQASTLTTRKNFALSKTKHDAVLYRLVSYLTTDSMLWSYKLNMHQVQHRQAPPNKSTNISHKVWEITSRRLFGRGVLDSCQKIGLGRGIN